MCTRMRITVAGILSWPANGMYCEEILSDFNELIEEDILACLAFAADSQRTARVAA